MARFMVSLSYQGQTISDGFELEDNREGEILDRIEGMLAFIDLEREDD
jgi:hypothetical protein